MTSSNVVTPAASILVYFREGPEFKFLMGCRSEKHRFMPGVFVYPGGKVDLADRDFKGRQHKLDLLPNTKIDGLSCNVEAFINAGVRELKEESGYEVAAQKKPDLPGDQRDYSLSPKGNMKLIARAITPPYPGLRYDTLFILLEVERPLVLCPEPESAELEKLGWFDIEQTKQLPVAGITKRIQRQGLAVAMQGENTPFLAQI